MNDKMPPVDENLDRAELLNDLANREKEVSVIEPTLASPAEFEMGILFARGTAEHSSGRAISYVYGQIFQDGDDEPMEPTVAELGHKDTDTKWFGWFSGGDCEPGSPYPDSNNLKIWVYYESDPEEPEVDPESGTLEGFEGKCVDEPMFAEANMKVSIDTPRVRGAGTPRPSRSLLRLGIEHSPVVEQDEWLRFQNLSVNDDHYGNRLWCDGKPLRAERIAVYGYNICWRSNRDEMTRIQNAGGTHANASGRFRFPGGLEYGIYVWQIGRRWHAITGEDCESATVIDLDPERDVFVQVNSLARHYSRHTGAFSIGLKILECAGQKKR